MPSIQTNTSLGRAISRDGTRTGLAVARLRALIVSGYLKPGERVSEREVAEHLEGVSRTPLREAFKILATEGLLTLEPNKGAVVTALSLSEVDAAIEVLIGLETMAAEPACANASEAEIVQIRNLHNAMTRAYEAGELMTYFEFNQSIHQHIVDAAKNPVLSRIYAAECARIRRYRYAGNTEQKRWFDAVKEHEFMLLALEQRAGPLLREILRKHHNAGWTVSRLHLQTQMAELY